MCIVGGGGFVFGYRMTAAGGTAVVRKNKTGRRCSERQRVFFVFGYRSVPFDRAVRFLWGVYCRRQRVFCVRASVGAV